MIIYSLKDLCRVLRLKPRMLKTTLIVSIVLWLFIGTVDGRQGLRNYMVSHDYRQSLRRDDYSVYDETDNELICKIESGAENSSNRFISLVAVPSLLSIATIRTVVTPFSKINRNLFHIK